MSNNDKMKSVTTTVAFVHGDQCQEDEIILQSLRDKSSTIQALYVGANMKSSSSSSIADLAASLQVNSSLNELCLEQASPLVLTALLNSPSEIKVLQINQGLDSAEIMHILTQYLVKNSRHVETLALLLEDSSLLEILSSGALSYCQCLREVRLICTEITTQGLAMFTQNLGPSVTNLKLEFPTLDSDQEVLLQHFFCQRRQQFHQLDLRMPIQKKETLEAIVSASCHFEKLVLHTCCLSSCCRDLISSLARLQKKNLTFLELILYSMNNDQDEHHQDNDATTFFWSQFLSDMNQLKSFSMELYGIELGESDIHQMTEACKSMKNLKSISIECDVVSCHLDSPIMEAWLDLIKNGRQAGQQSPLLTSFSFTPCTIEFEQEAHFQCELNSMRFHHLLQDRFPPSYWPLILERQAIFGSSDRHALSAMYHFVCEKQDVLVNTMAMTTTTNSDAMDKTSMKKSSSCCNGTQKRKRKVDAMLHDNKSLPSTTRTEQRNPVSSKERRKGNNILSPETFRNFTRSFSSLI